MIVLNGLGRFVNHQDRVDRVPCGRHQVGAQKAQNMMTTVQGRRHSAHGLDPGARSERL